MADMSVEEACAIAREASRQAQALAKINDVCNTVMQQKDVITTLKHQESDWRSKVDALKDNYSKVQALVLALSSEHEQSKQASEIELKGLQSAITATRERHAGELDIMQRELATSKAAIAAELIAVRRSCDVQAAQAKDACKVAIAAAQDEQAAAEATRDRVKAQLASLVKSIA